MSDRELQGFGADFMALARMQIYADERRLQLCIVPGRYDKVVAAAESASDASWHYYSDSLPTCAAIGASCDGTTLADWYGDANAPLRRVSTAAHGAVMARLYAPKQWLRDAVERRIGELRAEQAVVVHIRRGDKISGRWREITDEHSAPSIEDYYASAAQHRRGLRRLVVLADERSTVDAVEAINARRRVFDEVVYSRQETRRGGFGLRQMLTPLPADELHDEALVFFSLIETMRRAGVLVGARLSCAFVVGELLRAADSSGERHVTISLIDNPVYPTGYIFDDDGGGSSTSK